MPTVEVSPSRQLMSIQHKLETAQFAYTGAREKNKQFENRIAELQSQLERAATGAGKGHISGNEKDARTLESQDAEKQLEKEKGKRVQVEREKDEWEKRHWRLRDGVDRLLGHDAPNAAEKQARENATALSNSRTYFGKRKIVQSDTDISEESNHARSSTNGKKRGKTGNGSVAGTSDSIKRTEQENTAIILASFNRARRDAYAMRHMTPPRDLTHTPWNANILSRYFVRLINKPSGGVYTDWLREGEQGGSVDASKNKDRIEKVSKALEKGLL
ncbi:hypothetical protein I350_02504 [Cryptococcus amylolentus CBS 6273]|uniref:Uncharacterized protein n=1 Tax=Cryptococcus amylolentus CBS 6273 TaxID=1296118 RepID=A0A1E3KB82_9TREE|nr:hypothetical protein I350_02504 [Cryptococcus amylolentus CBS 6273]